jgi:hypothetical protein
VCLPLRFVPSSSWVKIFLGILSSSILSRRPSQLILCPFIHLFIYTFINILNRCLGTYWRILTLTDTFWHLLTHFDTYWHIFQIMFWEWSRRNAIWPNFNPLPANVENMVSSL